MPLIGYTIRYYGYCITWSSDMKSSSLIPRMVFCFVEDHVECPWPWWRVWPCCLVFLWAVPRNMPFFVTSIAHLLVGHTLAGVMPCLSTFVASHLLATFPEVLLLTLHTPLGFTSSSFISLWEFPFFVGFWRSFMLPFLANFSSLQTLFPNLGLNIPGCPDGSFFSTPDFNRGTARVIFCWLYTRNSQTLSPSRRSSP